MLIYATTTDLVPAWLPTAPANAAALLRRASNMVQEATLVDRYFVYPIPQGQTPPATAPAGTATGAPSDPLIAQAFNDAVCQQVTEWVNASINPDAGLVGQPEIIQSQMVPGGSVTYDTTESSAWLAAAVHDLCPASVTILRNAGLMTGRPEYM